MHTEEEKPVQYVQTLFFIHYSQKKKKVIQFAGEWRYVVFTMFHKRVSARLTPYNPGQYVSHSERKEERKKFHTLLFRNKNEL